MHHSPSSLSTASACERKWWYEYRLRIREPDITWEEIETWTYDKGRRLFLGPEGKSCTPRQRSAALGTAVHSVLETYYLGGVPNWETLPGQVALSGRAHLPAREHCTEIRVERPMGATPYPGEDEPDRTALVLDGAWFLGYVDLRVRMDPDGKEAKRLGISKALAMGNGWYTFDYKSSKDVDRYAITPKKAATDPQGILYPVDAMIAADTDAHGMRWVYMQTQDRRYAKPVDALVTYHGARAHLTMMVGQAKNLEAKRSVDECVPDPERCGDYGGCPHHFSRGGPCEATRKGRFRAMGFRDDYLKKQAELAAKGGDAPKSEAAPETTTPTPSAAPAAGATQPKKGGFGKNRAAASTTPTEPPPAPVEKPNTEPEPKSEDEAQEPASATVDAPVNAATSAITEAASSAPEPSTEQPKTRTRKATSAPASAPVENTSTHFQTVQTVVEGNALEKGERFEFRAHLTASQLAAVSKVLGG